MIQGVGISQEKKKKIFPKLQQLSKAYKYPLELWYFKTKYFKEKKKRKKKKEEREKKKSNQYFIM